ncbi:hypothetical protein [Anaerotalea alkaliphila]|uniref:Uncharacterized protein n=1 Tax=Anaerotalea alkaliphila TaxID=2662126 RepID=A0A7X5KM12_9FIRM|nr:hypothetical protein [Anaerotalea alkaliphila]NDL66479.1 hypothetical protein [Anaerotalea alkaliphila]
MSTAATTGAAAAAAAAISNAVKANGAIVYLAPEDFRRILTRTEYPMVVMAEYGAFTKKYKYLTAYQGFIFFAKSPEKLTFPVPVELIQTKKVWVPDM